MHELVASEVPKAYLFRGTKETTAQDVAKMLGLGLVQFKRPAGMPGPSAGAAGIGRFLLPYSECDYTLESIIDDLQVMQHMIKLAADASICICSIMALHTNTVYRSTASFLPAAGLITALPCMTAFTVLSLPSVLTAAQLYLCNAVEAVAILCCAQ